MLVVIAATVASYALGSWLGVPALLPVLNAATAWWVMATELRAGRTSRAIGVMLVWALVMAVCATTMAAMGWSRGPDDRALFLRGGYRDEMLTWVRTGEGAESTPSVFVPRHLATAAVFVAASAGSGGLVSMPMGAMQMNSMGEYVGAMAAGSDRPLLSAVLGWHPWAVARVVAFVILGVVFSGVVLSRLFQFPFSIAKHGGLVGLAASLLVFDIGLKWALAPAWGRLLRRVAGW